ncbi:hypothetical protein [Spiroplasma attinicola]|uniref:hypothetical protein n=1 Tax=Spiroplasma attinicola TaxID=2904537 RepID=UPI002022B319|nr:hypothetical protein [Spiroplasma sp. JKS002670]MCL8209584.1 hypothetical protein [Spiroplasma sp. JKS002670]
MTTNKNNLSNAIIFKELKKYENYLNQTLTEAEKDLTFENKIAKKAAELKKDATKIKQLKEKITLKTKEWTKKAAALKLENELIKKINDIKEKIANLK